MKALITGVCGQDGRYLTEYLHELGYEVVGMQRRSAQDRDYPDCDIVLCDITDASAVARVVGEVKPDEIYNLAAQSHVGESFRIPALTYQTNAVGALNVLEAARMVGAAYYQASTSELFGTACTPQGEGTPFHPRSPYAVAKAAAYWQTINYREAYGMRTANGILFNHESPRRGADFVTQKVCRHVAYIACGGDEPLKLGNLSARRDWGHAKDYVRAMHLALQHGGEFVVATGESHSVRDLCETAYSAAGLDYREWVQTDTALMRPSEVPDLRGNPAKIEALGWTREYDFTRTIKEMVDHAIHATT